MRQSYRSCLPAVEGAYPSIASVGPGKVPRIKFEHVGESDGLLTVLTPFDGRAASLSVLHLMLLYVFVALESCPHVELQKIITSLRLA